MAKTEETTFQKDLQTGKLGEDIIKKILENLYTYKLIDVSDNPNYYKEDIDFILKSNLNKPDLKIEIKTDSYKTGNMVWEEYSNCNSLVPNGCFVITKADFMFYYFSSLEICYIFHMQSFREWFDTKKINYNLIDFVTTKITDDKKYNSKGYKIKLLDIEQSLEQGKVWDKFSIGENTYHKTIFNMIKNNT